MSLHTHNAETMPVGRSVYVLTISGMMAVISSAVIYVATLSYAGGY